jgi:hypothetical protein
MRDHRKDEYDDQARTSKRKAISAPAKSQPAKAPRKSAADKPAKEPPADKPAPAHLNDADALMAHVAAEGGPAAAVLVVPDAFPDFKRGDLQECAALLGVNPYTTSRQFQPVRKAKASGATE